MENLLEIIKTVSGPILALLSVIISILVTSFAIFSKSTLMRRATNIEDSTLKSLEKLAKKDSKLVFNPNTEELIVQDSKETTRNGEIAIKDIKPTEIYITNHQVTLPTDDDLDKSILEDKILSFENEHLSNYYRQTLSQSNTSFWFSLIFASIGFTLIILASIFHATDSLDKTVVTLISGVIIDAVASLFFVQSNNSQKAVGAFFEKLRKDKQIHDARIMSDSIENSELKDSLKVKMSLSLLGLANAEEVAEKILQEKTKTSS